MIELLHYLSECLCEKDRPFHPLPKNFDGFKRDVALYDVQLDRRISLFNNGKLADELGVKFALNKNYLNPIVRGASACQQSGYGGFTHGVIAVCLLIEDAKIKTLGCTFESYQVLQPAAGPQC